MRGWRLFRSVRAVRADMPFTFANSSPPRSVTGPFGPWTVVVTFGLKPAFTRLYFSEGAKLKSQRKPRFKLSRGVTFQSSWKNGAAYHCRKNGNRLYGEL